MRKRFEKLLERYYDQLWSYVRFLTGGSTDSEDIVHQVFLRAHDRLASGENFRVRADVWLRGAARNLVRAWWREKRRLPENLADRLPFVAEQDKRGTSTTTSEEMMTALEHCLGKLSVDDQLLVSKRYEEGLQIVAIATQIQCNAATLRVRLFRIRQGLKRCMESILSQGGAA